MVTMGYQLVALNAKTGVPMVRQNGIIDLKQRRSGARFVT